MKNKLMKMTKAELVAKIHELTRQHVEDLDLFDQRYKAAAKLNIQVAEKDDRIEALTMGREAYRVKFLDARDAAKKKNASVNTDLATLCDRVTTLVSEIRSTEVIAAHSSFEDMDEDGPGDLPAIMALVVEIAKRHNIWLCYHTIDRS